MADISELVQRIKAAAEKASVGDWVQESGDGWDAICSNNDQANGGFIIAHFEGPDAAVNRKFVQSANPTNILALTAVLEKAQARIADLEAGKDAERREWMARGVESLADITTEYTDTDCIMDRYGISYEDAELWANGAQGISRKIAAYAAELRAGDVDL